MTTRVIRESWDGGDITVGASQQPGHILVSAYERGAERADLFLSAGELDNLIYALQAVRAEMAPADENAEAVAAVLASARSELLANCTPLECGDR